MTAFCRQHGGRHNNSYNLETKLHFIIEFCEEQKVTICIARQQNWLRIILLPNVVHRLVLNKVFLEVGGGTL